MSLTYSTDFRLNTVSTNWLWKFLTALSGDSVLVLMSWGPWGELPL